MSFITLNLIDYLPAFCPLFIFDPLFLQIIDCNLTKFIEVYNIKFSTFNMSNIRLFFLKSLSLNLTAKLDKSQSHYVNKVMRVKVNETFSLFNSDGEWEVKVKEIIKEIVEFIVTKQLRHKENSKEIWLAFSPIKSNYFNFMIQKATELGVTKFLPIIFDRTVVRKINKERLQKIIIEASEQSNRINVP